MSIINIESFKAKKEMKERALQRAKAYNVDVKEVITEMEAVAATEVTTTKRITVEEAMEALKGTVITPELLGINVLDNSIDNTDVKVIEWNTNIPW